MRREAPQAALDSIGLSRFYLLPHFFVLSLGPRAAQAKELVEG
jgi:hypothetical protein